MTRLLESAPYTHWHVDWRLPVDWLGTPGFIVAENAASGDLEGCLVVASDPPPAAWVRVAAIRQVHQGPQLLAQMWQQALPGLYEQGVHTVAWMQPDKWPSGWLAGLRFQAAGEIETFVKEDVHLPPLRPDLTVHVRALQEKDLPDLVAIEAAAFDPIWRHSYESLELGWKASFSFEVAELNEEVVGFQYSTLGQTPGSAHLVRLTVSPDVQGKSVGSALLTAALKSFWERRLTHVTLNTQVDNLLSQRLYAKFGFYPSGYRVPVWTCHI